jgi:alpha-beta hydrolase superfamily lysophospholipase
VAFGDKLGQSVKYAWMGAVAGQYPDIRAWSIPHTQDETALLKVKATLPYLVLHGTMDRHVDGQKLKDFMFSNFGNVDFHLWKNVGHASFFDAPDQTNVEIIRFAYKHCSN